MALKSVNYPLLIYLVCFKDLFSGEIQLYERFNQLFDHPDFFSAAGRSKDPRVYWPISFAQMVHGDNEQTLRILVGYYRQNSEILGYESGKLKKSINIKCDSTVEINDQIKRELDDDRTNEFSRSVDSIYQKYLHHHFNTWNDLSSPLIPSSAIL